MIDWTESARRTLDEFCARSRNLVAGSGADAEEVSDDLRRHVEEEVRAAQLAVVTETDVRRILARVGEPKSVSTDSPRPGEAPPATNSASPEKIRPGYFILLFTVVLPSITIGFELVTGIASAALFDPVPTWFHALLLAFVPGANLWMWLAGRARDRRHARMLGWCNSAAFGICAFYTILFGPFIPIAGLAILFFGAGLLPLSPALASISTLWLRKIYRNRIGGERLPGTYGGALAAVGVLVVLQLPTALTYFGLSEAASDNPATRNRGVRVLRQFGDEDLVLRAAYGFLSRAMDFDIVRLAATGGRHTTPEKAQEIYYRVTGEPFNSVPPPAFYTRAGRMTVIEDEFTWDEALGGESVAGRVKGLSMLSSRLDAVAEPDAAVAYCEWTIEFKNVSPRDREARAQVALPPGGVVSRVTLWINGEEREAAFGGRGQVREAYQEVAVVQRHDPLLVTTCGPDRVLVQCFPVPRDGGVMKVKLGITAPLVLESLEAGRFIWPHILERNFAVPSGLQHALWMQSSARMTDDGSGTLDRTDHGFALKASVSDSQFGTGSTVSVLVERPPGIESVWATTQDGSGRIRQQIHPSKATPVSRLIIVLDGSRGMQAAAAGLSQALTNMPTGAQLAVLIAGETVVELTGAPDSAAAVLQRFNEQLASLSYRGGQDNIPALEKAWDLASIKPGGIVLWVHGPQPVLLSSEAGLRQRLEHNGNLTQLLELQTRVGPDRVLEKLDGLPVVQHVPRLESIEADLNVVLGKLSGKLPSFEVLREHLEPGDGTVAGMGSKASSHVARLWARDETLRLLESRHREEAIALSSANHLVTPATGAVVLENKAQYERHDLTPADPLSVPAVPEPQPGAMMAIAVMLFAIIRRARHSA